MHHQFVGRPISEVESMSVSVNGDLSVNSEDTKFGSGLLYDSRVIKIAEAIRAGEIEGEIYSDGEVWANPQSLSHYIARQVPA